MCVTLTPCLTPACMPMQEAARPLGGGGGGGAGTTSDTGFLSRVSHGLRYGFSHGLSFAKRGMRASSDIRQRNGSGRAAGGCSVLTVRGLA